MANFDLVMLRRLFLLLALLGPCTLLAGPAPADQPLQPTNGGVREDEFMFEYLLSEMAAQRGEATTAIATLVSLAKRSADPRIARRAAEIAFRAGDTAGLEAATLLWLDLEPDALVARQVLAQLIGKDLNLAKQRYAVWLREAPRAGPLLLSLSGVLPRVAGKIDNAHAVLLATASEISAPWSDLPERPFMLAQFEQAKGDFDAAEALAGEALKRRPDWGLAAVLRAQILSNTSPEQAATSLQTFLRQYPDARDARLAYARVLMAQKAYLSAREEFRRLDIGNKTEPELPWAVALISLQIGDFVDAERYFKRALDLKPRDENMVFFNLGTTLEGREDVAAALGWYIRVTGGDYYVPSRQRAAALLLRRDGLEAARQFLRDARKSETPESLVGQQMILIESQLLRDAKMPEVALALLTEALEKSPGASELRYDRAMVAERLGRLELAESDLRRVIEQKPDHAHALNALGYTFAERNVRLDEAERLIRKAIALSPEDPAIQDSLAWIEYRRGNSAVALDILRKVYRNRRDPEIAAHLGEVLWTSGEKSEARAVLAEALKENPDNAGLRALVTKYAE